MFAPRNPRFMLACGRTWLVQCFLDTGSWWLRFGDAPVSDQTNRNSCATVQTDKQPAKGIRSVSNGTGQSLFLPMSNARGPAVAAHRLTLFKLNQMPGSEMVIVEL